MKNKFLNTNTHEFLSNQHEFIRENSCFIRVNSCKNELFNSVISEILSEEIQPGETFSLSVITESMSPFLKPTDEIIVRKDQSQGLLAGDIVVFRREGSIYAHRLLSKRKSDSEMRFVTKGDNAFYADRCICEGDILGKVVTIKRGSRSINLESFFWKVANRLISFLSLLEGALFLFGRAVKRSLWNH